MIISEQYEEMQLLKSEEYSCLFRDGRTVTKSRPMLTEHPLCIYMDGQMIKELICSPQYLAELVLGYLYTEGIVSDVDEIESISVRSDGGAAEVVLKDQCSLWPNSRKEKRKMIPVSPIFWKAEWIFHMADRFANGMPLHKKTWAAHSCFLAIREKILFGCEDIGRHNAFDKTVGHALIHGIDLTKCTIYSSGRIPVDMIEKTVLAGIPVLAAKADPTKEAVSMAQRYGLTLIGAARQDSMRVYADCASDLIQSITE